MAVVAGFLGALLLRRWFSDRRVEEEIKESVEARAEEWINEEKNKAKEKSDEEALADFENTFGGG